MDQLVELLTVEVLHVKIQQHEEILRKEIAAQARPFDAASPYELDGQSIMLCIEATLVLAQAVRALIRTNKEILERVG